VFMNPAPPREDENWRFLVEQDEEPSIRATAFQDFHNLAISITKRLVSATIFCAMSRLRALDSKSFNRYEMVKVPDVEAAAKTIGLKVNSDEFWIGCPRRCNLEMYPTISALASDSPAMDYDEVENMLRGEKRTSNHSPYPTDGEADSLSSSAAVSYTDERQSPYPTDGEADSLSSSAAVSYTDERQSPDLDHSGSESELEADEDHESIILKDPPVRDLASEYLEGVMLENYGPIDPSDSEYEHAHKHQERMLKRAQAKEKLAEAHEEYAEAFDLQASLIEEQRLWEVLKQDPPFTIKPENIELPEEPKQFRTEGEELLDWRNRLQFWSEWETLEQPIPSFAFSNPRERRRMRRTSPVDVQAGGLTQK
jgi:RNA polymerase I-specific transcription initiation factor RRN5